MSPTADVGRCFAACAYSPLCYYYVYDKQTETCILYAENNDYFDCDLIRGPAAPKYSDVSILFIFHCGRREKCYLFKVCGSNLKLLVTGGKGDIRTTEVIDLDNPRKKCQNWADHPIGASDAVGGFIGDGFLICNGQTSFSNNAIYVTDECYLIGPNKAELATSSKRSSLNPGAVAFDDETILITGGYCGYYGKLITYVLFFKKVFNIKSNMITEKQCGGGESELYNTTVFVTKDASTFGPEYPMNIFANCIIKISDGMVLSTGGWNGR